MLIFAVDGLAADGKVVNRLQQQHALVILITDNLCAYMDRVRAVIKDTTTSYDPHTYLPDNRYSHALQVSVGPFLPIK